MNTTAWDVSDSATDSRMGGATYDGAGVKDDVAETEMDAVTDGVAVAV